jgi:hypothetical protein
MSQKRQSFNKQNINNAQYKISRDSPSNEAQRELEAKLHEGQGGPSGLSPLR